MYIFRVITVRVPAGEFRDELADAAPSEDGDSSRVESEQATTKTVRINSNERPAMFTMTSRRVYRIKTSTAHAVR
jgi:hypothetical protein